MTPLVKFCSLLVHVRSSSSVSQWFKTCSPTFFNQQFWSYTFPIAFFKSRQLRQKYVAQRTIITKQIKNNQLSISSSVLNVFVPLYGWRFTPAFLTYPTLSNGGRRGDVRAKVEEILLWPEHYCHDFRLWSFWFILAYIYIICI